MVVIHIDFFQFIDFFSESQKIVKYNLTKYLFVQVLNVEFKFSYLYSSRIIKKQFVF